MGIENGLLLQFSELLSAPDARADVTLASAFFTISSGILATYGYFRAKKISESLERVAVLLFAVGLVFFVARFISQPSAVVSTSASVQGVAIAPGSEQDLVANIGDRIFFGNDSAALSPAATSSLDNVVAWLSKYPNVDILIAGNTDATDDTGSENSTESDNLEEAASRAKVVYDYLLAQGIAGYRMTTVSYGADCPVASGNDEAAFQQNRNVIISVQGFNPQVCDQVPTP